MTVTLQGLSTVVPPTVLVQEEVRDVFAAQPGLSRLGRRIVSTAFGESGIETRHTVLEELTQRPRDDGEAPVFFDAASGELLHPGTRTRNDIYAAHASRLYVDAGRAALEASGIGTERITHVITVSCTGFYAPGPDFEVARDLGLRAGVQRYHLGFMGCYAAMPALRLATQLCKADPHAAVLVISVELCTLHLRASDDPDTIVATSLFADGAAAGVVTSCPPPPTARVLGLDRFATRITPEGEGDMAWRIGDHGFEIGLSPAVPSIIGEHVIGAVEPLFAHEHELARALEDGAAGEAIAHWAVHPGGRSIVDRVQSALHLSDEQVGPPRAVLREYGNMSSATVMFVLRRILDSPAADGDRIAAMAFGPGLTVESALLTVRG
ncbi:type III polyketide synthase [Microbacterium sediminis]|uniref:Naringenin-chalcone synthase n=1 Tax=Microbacterium sediminis TaxID=904291 RepID=A0A1B9NFL5_9MICO|nr:type III polyketide synthase [Microbacterium sediminis]OCG75370.1 naringenin-chalcone synthase [Microbacterium sediminis]QBR74398.1 type III polyketide synthase [Microbacterium sediminis]